MRLSDFDYDLPEDLIAQEPLPEREASRLMVVPRHSGPFSHRHVRELPSLLCPNDLLVFNDARVIPSRLYGRKVATGGQVELLLVEPVSMDPGEVWYCLGTASKGLKPGQHLDFGGRLSGEVVEADADGGVRVRLSLAGDALLAALREQGEVPLPPYIRHPHVPASADPRESRYQTIFARRPGASAAPTAGLHFTERLFAALDAAGIARAMVTLFVGPGTFLPVRTEDVSQHRMHTERYEMPAETVAAVSRARHLGGRVIPVGTTSLRALESAAQSGDLRAGPGATDLFIVPGSTFRIADGLLTNFHQPRSTLLLLVAAMASRERILAAYQDAIAQRYRFYSWGDAMLIV